MQSFLNLYLTFALGNFSWYWVIVTSIITVFYLTYYFTALYDYGPEGLAEVLDKKVIAGIILAWGVFVILPSEEVRDSLFKQQYCEVSKVKGE